MDSVLVFLVLALIVAAVGGSSPPPREPLVITVAPPEPAERGGWAGLALLGFLICLLAFGGLG